MQRHTWAGKLQNYINDMEVDHMMIAKVLVSIGALALAGACGVLLGWLEKKAWEAEKQNGKHLK